MKMKVGMINFVEFKERFDKINDYILSLGMALVLM
jgi:hypothetical protein